MRDARLGWLVRGLHFFGASAIVIVAALHLLRVIVFGSYKPPRELTWLTGVALLLVLLAFALTGYLLPWDQRAYWATVVTINIARSRPSSVRRSRRSCAAGRDRRADVDALVQRARDPAAGAAPLLVVLHLFLMRRHGISGPVTKVSGTVFDGAPPKTVTFFPYQAARDVTVTLVVAAVLVALAWRGMPALEAPADPADATYTPRPEWYFLGLFQLLKYFPGRWEIVGALVIPGLALGALALLPWIDRGPERDPRRRRGILAAADGGRRLVVALTTAGREGYGPRQSAGTTDGASGRRGRSPAACWVAHAGCDRCHAEAAMADAIGASPLARPPTAGWRRTSSIRK